MNFFDGYNIASNKSVTRLGQSMIDAFTQDDFYNAVNGRVNDVAAHRSAIDDP